MHKGISRNKWYYMLFGLVGITLLCFPLATDGDKSFYFFHSDNSLNEVLFTGVIYPILIVFFNFAYRNVYKEDYYNKAIWATSIGLPLISLLGLIYLKEGMVSVSGSYISYTFWYLLLLIYVLSFYSYNIYVMFRDW